MIRDFGDKNRQSHAVLPELTKYLPSHLLTRTESDAVFKHDAEGDWKRFYEKYPGAPGIITVSRVGLNREKNRALFYLGEMGGVLAGGGRLHVLKKEGDEWVEHPVQTVMEWVS